MKSAYTLLPLLAGVILSSTAGASNLRIIGGDKVSLAQYPYMAGLVNRGESAEQVFCGASVINAKWILTAAHCLQGVTADSLDVVTGISALSKADVGQRIAAARIIVHPDYDDNSVENDIALIELSSPTNALAVSVATSADTAAFATGNAVSVSGWGNLSTTGENFPDVLHAVDLQVSDFSACSNVYGGLGVTQLCATVPGGKKDSCQGDSGGPLVAKTAQGAVQVGIVSFGDACASATHPGVYTKVSAFSDFLKRAGVEGASENVVTVAGTTTSPVNVAPVAGTDALVEATVDGGQNSSVVENVDGSNGNGNGNGNDNDNDNDNEFDADGDIDVDFDYMDEFDSQAIATSESANVEVAVVEPFFHVVVNDTSWGAVELYNGGAESISLSNIQLPQGVSVDSQSADCTAVELSFDEACYIDLNWTPMDNSDLNDKMSIDIFDGASNETVSLPLLGAVIEPVAIGNEIDWPEAEYYSTYPDEWEYDNTDVASGDSAISSNMDSTETLDLIGEFDEQETYELQFEYQLDGVNCYIYFDDELVYELAAFEQWQSASFEVPADVQVRWEFRAMTRDRGQRKVRLDALKVNGAKAAIDGNQLSGPVTGTSSAIANVGNESGAGSTGAFGVVVLFLLLSMRSVALKRRRVL